MKNAASSTSTSTHCLRPISFGLSFSPLSGAFHSPLCASLSLSRPQLLRPQSFRRHPSPKGAPSLGSLSCWAPSKRRPERAIWIDFVFPNTYHIFAPAPPPPPPSQPTIVRPTHSTPPNCTRPPPNRPASGPCWAQEELQAGRKERLRRGAKRPLEALPLLSAPTGSPRGATRDCRRLSGAPPRPARRLKLPPQSSQSGKFSARGPPLWARVAAWGRPLVAAGANSGALRAVCACRTMHSASGALRAGGLKLNADWDWSRQPASQKGPLVRVLKWAQH